LGRRKGRALKERVRDEGIGALSLHLSLAIGEKKGRILGD